ncbi:MAG: hypothetical protein ACRCTU_13730 [Zoogloea sp.]|uniref:hypothetical protein n=1 Tax=Zoogloea sp. TaxID=49181 RepID=UPI003F33D211
MHAITSSILIALLLQSTPSLAAPTPQPPATTAWGAQAGQPHATPPVVPAPQAPDGNRVRDSFTRERPLPEPGSFAFAGLTLAAVGLFLRKRP